jgi:hypothetical protein
MACCGDNIAPAGNAAAWRWATASSLVRAAHHVALIF